MQTILIIDDEFGIVEVLGDILRDEGYVVIAADGGASGIEALNGEPPDLVFVDLMMPIVTGKHVLAYMRESPHCAGIPIIVMSGLAEATLLSDGDEPLPYAAYLRKPFRLRELLALLEQVLGPRL